MDANHCPGAVQFLFKVRGSDGRKFERYIHTGDFRFNDSMKNDPILCQFVGSDAVFLDTTYCNPKFAFPSQEESIDYVASTIERIRDENKVSEERILILIATYVIGKERILLEISRRLNCLLHVDSRKMEILTVLGLGDTNVFTEDVLASSIHVIGWNVLGETWPYFRPNFVKMKEIMLERGYSKAVGFVSTGWMYETKKKGFSIRSKDELVIHLVPYSEHSSYEELREFVRFLRPKRVIPTVGVDVENNDGKNVMALQKHFQWLVDEKANKQDFLMAFSRKAGNAEVMAEKNESCSTFQTDVEEEDPLRQKEPLSVDFNVEGMEEAEKELRDSLPSWVTQDQVLGLLQSCNGDVVEAVSEFFEHEIEFHEKAKAAVPPATDPHSQTNSTPATDPGSETTSHNDVSPFPALNSFQGNQVSSGKFVKLGKKSVSPLASAKSSLSKKRVSVIGNKPKKKGKSSTVESSGSKQSTITKFFGKAVSSSSHDEHKVITAREMNDGMSLITDSLEAYKQEVDQFLQIIDNGIARNTAASLMEKVKGDVAVALDMYYSMCSHVFGDEEVLTPLSPGVHASTCVVSSGKVSSSQETQNLPSLFVHGTSADDTSVINVSLPIDKYSPVEHGLYFFFVIDVCWKAVWY